jgi:hypothetical protein
MLQLECQHISITILLSLLHFLIPSIFLVFLKAERNLTEHHKIYMYIKINTTFGLCCHIFTEESAFSPHLHNYKTQFGQSVQD